MKKIENECVDCEICVSCGQNRVSHWYCDKCGDETKLYYFNGEELCIDCIEDELDLVEWSDCY